MTKKELLSEELMTFKEVQAYFKKGSTTIDRWVEDGILKKYGVAGSVYFYAHEVKSVLKPLTKAA